MALPDAVSAYIALGANLGEPRARVKAAIETLDDLPQTRLLRASSLYRTTPVGIGSQPDFINAAAQVETRLSPQSLLLALHAQEAAQGRARGVPNAPRTLDLDLLLYADKIMRTPDLILPHPRLHLRAFVLVPLREIAPGDLPIFGRGTLAAWLPAVYAQMSGVTRL
ncbi:MAG: 2-amino-4-hydroxy-6-hydroxymethyldihydropteridine diphosphokinase [Zoogloeaceae bacterium]|jgi:2-amino-4-hydroxy-6-hydroxymethyldihydropteridine diphosphokinase|nr:2-amino-4-hydroxy-6-hydroxymethyldihydropteridine diphosphokinase [Zoogloeaceae bacterium]